MEILIFWILASVAVGIWGSNKGRSGFGWFLFSLLLSPLLGALFVAASKNLLIEREAERRLSETKRCPRCAERVKKEAAVCRFCGYEFQKVLPHRDIKREESAIIRGLRFRTCETSSGWFYHSDEPGYEASGGPYKTKIMARAGADAEIKIRRLSQPSAR
jgi:hypothetical protein